MDDLLCKFIAQISLVVPNASEVGMTSQHWDR
jgi:hypothetical protein